MQCLLYSLWKPKQVFFVSSFKREGGRREEGHSYFPKWLSGFLPLFPAFLLGVFFSRLPGWGWGGEGSIWHQQTADSSIARSPHREKLMTSSVILKKICFFENLFMIFWTGEAMPQQRSQSCRRPTYLICLQCRISTAVWDNVGSIFHTWWWLCCGHGLSCGFLGSTFAFCQNKEEAIFSSSFFIIKAQWI